MRSSLLPLLVVLFAVGIVRASEPSAPATAPAATPAPAPAPGPAPRIHLVGDSTMADKENDPPNPEHGWGQMLPRYLKDPSMVINYAHNGRSTKSFIDEGRWQTVVEALKPGDWVIIQFGHNDAKIEDPKRYAAPRGAYQENLRRFVRETREHGANPVLATSVVRRKWDAAGKLEETLGEYPEALREVAREMHVPLLELHDLTKAMEEGHGVEGSKKIHLWIPAGVYKRKPEGWQDDTHFTAYGADRVAALAVQEILRLQLPLAAWVQ